MENVVFIISLFLAAYGFYLVFKIHGVNKSVRDGLNLPIQTKPEIDSDFFSDILTYHVKSNLDYNKIELDQRLIELVKTDLAVRLYATHSDAILGSKHFSDPSYLKGTFDKTYLSAPVINELFVKTRNDKVAYLFYSALIIQMLYYEEEDLDTVDSNIDLSHDNYYLILSHYSARFKSTSDREPTIYIDEKGNLQTTESN